MGLCGDRCRVAALDGDWTERYTDCFYTWIDKNHRPGGRW